AIEISQSSGTTNLVANETIHDERGDSVERAATTDTSLNVEQGSGNIIRTQSTATLNEPIPHGTGSSSGLMRQDTILRDRPAQTRVLDLENVKDAQALEIQKWKKRVKNLESNKKSRTPQLKRRLFKDSETQGRYGHDIGVNTASTSITTASINITTAEPVTTASAPITTAGVSISIVEPSTPPTTKTTKILIKDEDLTIAQTLMNMKKLDEEARLEREREEEASKAANIAEWDDVQAMMDADYELATKL
ncbi:hypothetical protein Tco_0496769, partial [Tanacetum coccineum]